MSKQAILFGSIGVLVETSEIQRQSFNQAFKEAGLNWSWDRETYRTLLKSSGGEKRIREYATKKGEDVDAGALHKRKTEIFDDTMVQQGLSLRDGVAEVIQRAQQYNVKLAFVTTTSRANVDAIFEALGDSLQRGDFDFVGDTSVTAAAKPSPDTYEAAVDASQRGSAVGQPRLLLTDCERRGGALRNRSRPMGRGFVAQSHRPATIAPP